MLKPVLKTAEQRENKSLVFVDDFTDSTNSGLVPILSLNILCNTTNFLTI